MPEQTPGAQRPDLAEASRFTRQLVAVKAAIATRFGPISPQARIAVAVGLATVLVFGATAGGFGIVAAANASTRTNAFTDNKLATERLVTARSLDAKTVQKLNAALVAGAALNAKVAGFVTAAPGVVGPAALAGLEATRTKLATAVTSIAKDRSVDLTTGLPSESAIRRVITKAPAVSSKTDTVDVAEATRALDSLTGEANGSVKGSTFLIGIVDTATSAVTKSVAPVVTSVAAAGQARLDGSSSAGAAERDAVVAAIAAVKDDDTALDTLIAYTTATTAVKASHDAVEAQKAAEAAAAAAAAQAAADAASRNSGGGSSSGGSSSGGGSASGGGNSSSGGGSSSGGTTPPASNWRPMQTHYDSGTCQGAGGGQFVSYGSTLNLPVGAFDIRFYETPGEGWGSKWSCDTGW